MKHFLLSILIICSINCLAQEPNPDLFQTWYLQSVLVSDGAEPTYIVSDIEPNITPTLTIMEDLTFSGIAACNTFNGTFNLLSSNILETDQFSYSTDDCGVEIHNNFENAYYNFIQLLSGFSITSVDNGLILDIETPIFGNASFRNYQLSITEQKLQHIKIYPNPTNSIIHLNSQNNPIIKIQMFNLMGRLIKSIKNNLESLNISDLSNGLYILKIETEYGPVTKKILKE
jgi:heat shock protein HslJ